METGAPDSYTFDPSMLQLIHTTEEALQMCIAIGMERAQQGVI